MLTSKGSKNYLGKKTNLRFHRFIKSLVVNVLAKFEANILKTVGGDRSSIFSTKSGNTANWRQCKSLKKYLIDPPIDAFEGDITIFGFILLFFY